MGPISLHEDAVQKEHAPTGSGYVFKLVFHKEFEIAELAAAPGEADDEQNIRHALVIAHQHRILTVGNVVAGKFDIHAGELFRHNDPNAPDASSKPGVDGAKQFGREGIDDDRDHLQNIQDPDQVDKTDGAAEESDELSDLKKHGSIGEEWVGKQYARNVG